MNKLRRTNSLKERFGKGFHITVHTDSVQGHHGLGANAAGRSSDNGREEDENLEHSASGGGTVAVVAVVAVAAHGAVL